MDFWGCEFVEENAERLVPQFASGIVDLEMDLLGQIVDTRYIREIAIKDAEQIQALTADIARRGILNPGLLIYDDKKVRLKDGNHRYVAAKNLQLRTFPVTLVRTSNIQAPGASLEFVLHYLLTCRHPKLC